APSVSAVRALGTALMLSFTTASSGSESACISGIATCEARHVESAAAKKETVTGQGRGRTWAHVSEAPVGRQRAGAARGRETTDYGRPTRGGARKSARQAGRP